MRHRNRLSAKKILQGKIDFRNHHANLSPAARERQVQQMHEETVKAFPKTPRQASLFTPQILE